MRRYIFRSSALWCVTNGRAAAPPGIGCIIGVSTSMKIQRVEEIAQVAQDARAGTKHLAAALGHDQVDVALPVTQFGVRHPVPLVRQRAQ
jgi:hypothetical protein